MRKELIAELVKERDKLDSILNRTMEERDAINVLLSRYPMEILETSDVARTIPKYEEVEVAPGRFTTIPIERAKGLTRESPEKRKDGETPPNEIQEAMVLALEEHGGPMHIQDLLNKVTSLGITVNGKRPASTLSAHASNDPRILSYRQAGFKKGHWTLAPSETN